ncbi:MAG: histidine phosphatase family protein [Thermodesulfovibrionales bacterium]|nr:histidine phosphatase family protein [Thermodesulfovibrionales bacterium]
MVETIYIIRHGATVGSDDDEPRYKGSIDVPLSPKGRAQVVATASFMESQGMRPDAVYCSSLSRARVSAELICDAFDGLAPIEHAEFKERHFGRWEDMSFNEIAKEFPEDFSAWAKDPLNFSPIDGESTLEVRDRVMPKLDEVLNGHDGGAVALVAHGGVNRVILCELMGLSLEHIFRIEQDNACLNIVRFYDGTTGHAPVPVVKLINYTHGATHWMGATGPI